jgi:hypothetical protein
VLSPTATKPTASVNSNVRFESFFLAWRNDIAPSKFKEDTLVGTKARGVGDEQFLAVPGNADRMGWFFGELRDKIFKLRSN